MKLKEYTDEQLIAQYKKNGNGNYAAELYKRYTKMVMALGMKYLKDKILAKEATLQVFENVIINAAKYEITNFKSWIISVTRNHCFYLLRQRKSIIEYCDFFEKNIEDVVEFEDVFTLSDKEKQELQFDNLETALDKLPQEQSKCLRLFYMEGNSYKQVEQITGWTYKQIKSYIQNGRRKLKIILKQLTKILAPFLICFLGK